MRTYFPHRHPSVYGRVLNAEPPPLNIPRDPVQAMEFAARVDREADLELQAGHVIAAERLSHLALEARCRATGCRA